MPNPRTEDENVEVAMPRPVPELRSSRAAGVEVAVPATVVVERYRLPPAFLKAHCAKPVPAESENCGSVEEKEVNGQVPVVVANPTSPVKFGAALKVRKPVPTSSVTRAISSDETSIEVEETLLLKILQSAESKHPKTPEVAVLHTKSIVLSAS